MCMDCSNLYVKTCSKLYEKMRGKPVDGQTFVYKINGFKRPKTGLVHLW